MPAPAQDAAIQQALDAIMRNEGGWSDAPADRGGATMRGVTLTTLQRLRPGSTIDDLRALTDADARTIYLAQYIHAPGIDQLPPAIIPQVSDISVNSGPLRAIRLLQQALGAEIDGVLGPRSLAAAQDAVAKFGAAFNNQIADQRQAFYSRIVATDPTQGVFLSGWSRRCDGFRVSV